MNLRHELFELLLIHLRIFVVAKILMIGVELEYRNDLILTKTRKSIKVDDGMFLAEVRIGIVAEVAEHGPVFHVVSIDDEVIADTGRTGFVNIRHSVVAVCFLKAVIQIIVGAVRRLYAWIINLRTLNLDPADKVFILLKKSTLLFMGKSRLLCGKFFLGKFRFFRAFGFLGALGFRFGLNIRDKVSQFIELLDAVLRINILVREHCSRKNGESAKDRDGNMM